MTRTTTGLSVSEILIAALVSGVLVAAAVRAEGFQPLNPGEASSSGTMASLTGGPNASNTAPEAAASPVAAAEEAEKTARTAEHSAGLALEDALRKVEEAVGKASAAASGGSGDSSRKAAEEAKWRAAAARWEVEKIRLIHSMTKTDAAMAADLQFIKNRYDMPGETTSGHAAGGVNPAGNGAGQIAGGARERERQLQASGTAAADASGSFYPPVPAPRLTLSEIVQICFGVCLLGALFIFWKLHQKELRAAGSEAEDRLSELMKRITVLDKKLAALRTQPAEGSREDTPPIAAVAALPPHAELAMSCTVPVTGGNWRKICQDALRMLDLIRDGRRMVNELPEGLEAFPLHQQVAWQMLNNSRSQLSASKRMAWTVRMRDAMASGLLHDPELPDFSNGTEDPEHHFRRRFIRDVLTPEISPLLVVMEEMRHLNRFLPQVGESDLNDQPQQLKQAMDELIQLCLRDFEFDIEYVPLLEVCDFRSLKIIKNCNDGRLPSYYKELNCTGKEIRGVLRYGNQSTGLTPHSPTEIVYSP